MTKSEKMVSRQRDAIESQIVEVERRLGYEFTDRSLLKRALTHSSYANEQKYGILSNERLEFLGDRVVGLVIASVLYERYHDAEEGELARRHAAIVRRDALAGVAKAISLDDALLLSRGEEEGGGRTNPTLLADALEAVIAALYLDGGFERASLVTQKLCRPLLDITSAAPDAKTRLQEWAQGHGLPSPRYLEIARQGPAHAPYFTIEVVVGDLKPVCGEGRSKRAAEQAAAEAALEAILMAQ
jgi:ribonuclease-3